MRAMLTLSVLVFGGCPDPDETTTTTDTATDSRTTETTDSPTDDTTLDLGGTEGEVQDLLLDFGERYPGYSEAAERLFDAYNGGKPKGVTLTPPSPLRTGIVQVDTDLDGTFDEDWDVTLSQPEGAGTPVAVSARTGGYGDPTSTDLDVEMSTDGKTVTAAQASFSSFGEDVTMHGSKGAFEFGLGLETGQSAGQMEFVAYTPNPDDDVVSGRLDLVSDGIGGFVLQAEFENSTLRNAPISVPMDCHCHESSCSQGPTPASFLVVSAFIGLIAVRRRRR